MKIGKIVITVLLSLIIALSCISLPVGAAEGYDPSLLTYFYIDKGSISIGADSVSGYGLYGEKIEDINPAGYLITTTNNSQTSNTITIKSGKQKIFLKDVDIKAKNQQGCALSVTGNADVDIYLDGTNKLVSGNSRAGLEISASAKVTINGSGSLYAFSAYEAGIGGGNGASNGTLTVNSGAIEAVSGSESAGIGGGSSGNGGNLTINGGVITAIGGDSGAGIGGGCTGGGGNITINGGTITATGGANAAGIGGGWYGDMGNIVINGGSVKAQGNSAPSIGAGAGMTSGTLQDSSGNSLRLFQFDSSGIEDMTEIYVNNKNYNIPAKHLNDNTLYLYVPQDEFVIAAKSHNGTPSFYECSLNQAESQVSVNIFSLQNGAYLDNNSTLKGISPGLKNLSNYFSFSQGYTLSASDLYYGTGSQAVILKGDVPVFSFTCLVYGDIDGDGFCDGRDSFLATLIAWEKLTEDDISSLYYEAADCNRDAAITIEDAELLSDAGVRLSAISQAN